MDVKTARQVEEGMRRVYNMSVRCSALGLSNGRVRVLFRDLSETTAYEMDKATYHAIPLDKPATIGDYRKVGAVVAVPFTDFDDLYR